jgi:hypothetical protein
MEREKLEKIVKGMTSNEVKEMMKTLNEIFMTRQRLECDEIKKLYSKKEEVRFFDESGKEKIGHIRYLNEITASVIVNPGEISYRVPYDKLIKLNDVDKVKGRFAMTNSIYDEMKRQATGSSK